MSADLLPCPFCGGDANAKPHSQHQPGCYFDVLASFKAASGIGDLSMNPELLASWNRRAQPAATPAAAQTAGQDFATVDYLGVALDLASAARASESQTLERLLRRAETAVLTAHQHQRAAAQPVLRAARPDETGLTEQQLPSGEYVLKAAAQTAEPTSEQIDALAAVHAHSGDSAEWLEFRPSHWRAFARALLSRYGAQPAADHSNLLRRWLDFGTGQQLARHLVADTQAVLAAQPAADTIPRHVAQTLATAIYEAAQKMGIANGDHSDLSVPQCLHLLDCMTQPAASAEPEWIDDPHDIEQGMMRNPAYRAPVAAQAPAAAGSLLNLVQRSNGSYRFATEAEIDQGRVDKTLMALPDAAGDARDAAFEAVRQRLCKLQRYSFSAGATLGCVRRVEDHAGNWIEFDAAHQLLDSVAVDAAVDAMSAGREG